MIADIVKINPAAKIGLMPVPSMVAGDDPTFAGGEKTTWGAWKDSTNLDAAKQFISYYAKPENAAAVCKNTGLASGLIDVQADLGDLTQYYSQYKDIRVFTYFDRINLPNGIWDPMCKYGQDLFAGAITPKQFDDSMQKDYDRLWAASK
jgi:raffinose/stachyose/melibiose transport system substrate-binding protein